MKDTYFLELAALCEALEGTKKKKDLAQLLGRFLTGLAREEIPQAVSLILGRAANRPLEVSVAAVLEVVSELMPLDEEDFRASFSGAPDFGEAMKTLFAKGGLVPSGERLTIGSVFRIFREIAEMKGPGVRDKKKGALLHLLQGASSLEVKYIVKNIIGERRHGVDEGTLLAALSATFRLELGLLRRANLLTGDLGKVAEIAISEGTEGLGRLKLQLFRPLKPMLAQMAGGMEDVFSAMKTPFALEYKLDGARIQVHKKGEACRLFSRHLTEVTESFPDILEQVRQARIDAVVLDGEVIAVSPEGFPLPFQVLMRRLGRVREIDRLVQEIPVRLFLFDIIFRDGDLLIDMPYQERWQILETAGLPLVPRLIPETREEGKDFFRKAVDAGFEGLLAKALASHYTPGARGKAWLKVKKAHSLDLVIVAAEWGYGRRRGWLSNYQLAARDERTGEYLPVGKTYKGFTDSEFEKMTRRLLSLKTGESFGAVVVKPQVVVEVIFSDIQKSPRYRSGLVLRFARIATIREDKPPEEIDTIQTMAKLYRAQLERQKFPKE